VLEVRPVTGRTHQIRVQLAAIGCPIVGDRKYGAPEGLPDRAIALWATGLDFTHPTTKARIEIRCEPPHGWPFSGVQRA
jgi:23S rRNA pseudouridine1911/1915/1917 synthase